MDTGRAVSELTSDRSLSSTDEISEVMQRVPRHVWTKVIGGVGAGDARALLEQVAVPTLIIHDPGNTYIPVEAAHYLYEHIAGSQLEITEEYGAMALGDGVKEKIDQFIEEVINVS